MSEKAGLIYRGILLLLLLAFLSILYQYSQNGRYIHYIYNGEVMTERIIDSRNGVVFAISSGKAYKIDFPSGQMTTAPVESIEIPPVK